MCFDIDNYQQCIEELKKEESDTDTTVHEKEADFDRCELERAEAEMEATEAEERYQKAQKKAAKSQMIGAGLGALVAAFTNDDSWTVVGGAIGGVVAEIDGKIQQKRRKVLQCKVALENAQKAVAEARSSLGEIRGKIEEYKYRITQNHKEIDSASSTIEAIERLVIFHKKSATFWGMFCAAATASLETGSQLLNQVVKSGEEVVDTRPVAVDQILTVAKPFLETWELLALIDLKNLF